MQPVVKEIEMSAATGDVKSQAIIPALPTSVTWEKSALEFNPTRIPGPRLFDISPPRNHAVELPSMRTPALVASAAEPFPSTWFRLLGKKLSWLFE